jgi:predicted  nucleic acid-binding Zn-ribbon protein
MRPVMLLAQLNEIDLSVDALKARLTEIAQEAREPETLVQTRAALATAQAEQARCRKTQVACEIEQKRIADHLAKAEKSLYSGKGKSPKELEAAQLDVQQLRRQLSHADDELLEALVCMEAATEAVEMYEADQARLTAEWEARRAQLRAEHALLKTQLAQDQTRQLAARKATPDAVLVIYDALRPRRAGRAVAMVDNDQCSACGVAVPQSKIEAAREGDEFVYCGNCGRILWSES